MNPANRLWDVGSWAQRTGEGGEVAVDSVQGVLGQDVAPPGHQRVDDRHGCREAGSAAVWEPTMPPQNDERHGTEVASHRPPQNNTTALQPTTRTHSHKTKKSGRTKHLEGNNASWLYILFSWITVLVGSFEPRTRKELSKAWQPQHVCLQTPEKQPKK